MRTTLLSLLALALVAGCEPAAPAKTGGGPTVPAGHFVRRAGGSNLLDALVDGDNVTGANVSFTRYTDAGDHSLRGTIFTYPLDVAVSGPKVSGLIGSSPVDITTERREEKLHVEGMLRGAPSNFDVSASAIDGKIGPCDYHLAWTGKDYRGSRGCSGGGGNVEVEVPEALKSWSDAELGAAVGLLLSFP